MAQPEPPASLLKRAVSRMAAAQDAIRAESDRIAQERAQAGGPPAQPTMAQP